MSDTETSAVIAERKSTHGHYADVAETYKRLIETMRAVPHSWEGLSPVQQLSIEMIAHKLARIISGNPDFADHWLDIEGYARLARMEIKS